MSNSFGSATSSSVALTVAPAPTYPLAQAILTNNPLGYWRLDETSGTVARDYAANNNGTYGNTQLGQTGNKLIDPHTVVRFGFLATSNSCVTNINLDFATSGSATFSVEAWVNGGSQTSDAGLVTKGYGNGGEQFNLDCGGGSHAFRFFVRDANGSAKVATSSVTPNNQWHHLVGVCDQVNGFVRLYVDGVQAAQATLTPNTGILGSTATVSIGSRQAGVGTAFNNQFAGYMEEVAIYGYALSASQVLTHYQAATNRAPVSRAILSRSPAPTPGKIIPARWPPALATRTAIPSRSPRPAAQRG
ncbi:MAG: LamG domain-containing protein [Verrucomicrobiota bacterium]